VLFIQKYRTKKDFIAKDNNQQGKLKNRNFNTPNHGDIIFFLIFSIHQKFQKIQVTKTLNLGKKKKKTKNSPKTN